jgi:hypothetical protein
MSVLSAHRVALMADMTMELNRVDVTTMNFDRVEILWGA